MAHALDAIPFEQREVVVLHLKGALTFREIARLQNTTLSTAHGRYRYGLKKLNRILQGTNRVDFVIEDLSKSTAGLKGQIHSPDRGAA
ncbi:MAG: hypothetical protein GY809_11325 [Planctomycetes bacterium]|nr:hypothetical protein [Planctomycetota bacterium]